MILSLVLSKIKFQGRIISAAPPTRQFFLEDCSNNLKSGTGGLAPAHAC